MENIDKRGKIVRDVYGSKSAGANFWRHVRSAMNEMGFKSCKVYLNVWFRPATKSDGTDYYQYVLLYNVDILAIMQDPDKFIREGLDSRFIVKPKSICKPTQYLGNNIFQVTMKNGVETCSCNSSQYVRCV